MTPHNTLTIFSLVTIDWSNAISPCIGSEVNEASTPVLHAPWMSVWIESNQNTRKHTCKYCTQQSWFTFASCALCYWQPPEGRLLVCLFVCYSEVRLSGWHGFDYVDQEDKLESLQPQAWISWGCKCRHTGVPLYPPMKGAEKSSDPSFPGAAQTRMAAIALNSSGDKMPTYRQSPLRILCKLISHQVRQWPTGQCTEPYIECLLSHLQPCLNLRLDDDQSLFWWVTADR